MSAVIGRNAVILIGATAVGFAKDCEVMLRNGVIQDWKMGDDDPAITEHGNNNYTVRFSKMHINTDSTYAAALLAGTAVTVEIAPSGTASGNMKIQLTSSQLSEWTLRITQNGVELTDVLAVGGAITFGTYT